MQKKQRKKSTAAKIIKDNNNIYDIVIFCHHNEITAVIVRHSYNTKKININKNVRKKSFFKYQKENISQRDIFVQIYAIRV